MKAVIEEIMKLRGYTYQRLADKMGYKRSANIFLVIDKPGTRIDILTNICESMDCSVIVKSRLADKTIWNLNEQSEKEVVREVMKQRGYSMIFLAEKCGYSTASAISTKLAGKNGMRTDILNKLLSAMDCEIVIKSKLTDKGEWRIG